MARGGLELLQRTRRIDFGPGEWERLVDSAPLDVSMMPLALDYTPRYTTRQTLALWRTGYLDPPDPCVAGQASTQELRACVPDESH